MAIDVTVQKPRIIQLTYTSRKNEPVEAGIPFIQSIWRHCRIKTSMHLVISDSSHNRREIDAYFRRDPGRLGMECIGTVFGRRALRRMPPKQRRMLARMHRRRNVMTCYAFYRVNWERFYARYLETAEID